MSDSKVITHYKNLTPWPDYSADDHIIAEHLRKKILKEANSTIAFYCVVLLTSLLFFIFEAMIELNTFLAIIFFIISCGLIALISNVVHLNKEKRKLIDNRGFKTCEITAFDIDETYNQKFCHVMDKEGNVLTETLDGNENQKPVPYYSLFSLKEDSGTLVVLPSITKNEKDYVIVFPASFLKCEREKDK